MKVVHLFPLAVLVSFCFSACNSGPKPHVVDDVVDGNTLQLDGGTTLHLIGIADTRNGHNFLMDYRGKQVRVVPDSEAEALNTDSVQYGYACLNNGTCLNAEMLRRGVAPFDDSYVRDSLQAFKTYAGETKGQALKAQRLTTFYQGTFATKGQKSQMLILEADSLSQGQNDQSPDTLFLNFTLDGVRYRDTALYFQNKKRLALRRPLGNGRVGLENGQIVIKSETDGLQWKITGKQPR